MICLNPSRIYFHYKGKGLYVVKKCILYRHGRKSEYGIYISIALGMLIFASLLGKISLLKDVLNEVSNVVGLNSDYFKTLWKILGITYAAEFSSAICKDAGYQTIALQIEVFAKITILVLSLPVLSALLQTIRGFLV